MFRTEIPLTPDPKQLTRTARVLTMGSCFADSIGNRLMAHKVTTLVNPFGTVFNPLSATLLLRAVAGEPVDWTQHVVEARGRWQSYDLHGSIGADSAEAMLAHIQELVQRTAEFVRSADVLALTLGTAWVYRLRETGELVSNCHKMPAALFEKELLAPEDIVSSVAEAHALLRRSNPKLRLLITLSPVRHLRDTLPLNSVSKGVLRLAAHYLSDMLPDVSYFPAYELLTDDLRDYRFYAADMLHPSPVAEDYIWERFARTYFDADFGRFRKDWDGIQQALAHQPLHPGAPEHRQFLETTLEKLRRLVEQQVDVRAEVRDVERRLLALPPPPRPKPAPAPEPEDDEERIDIGQPEAEAAAQETDAAPQPAENVSQQAVAADASAQVTSENTERRTGRNRGRGRSNRKDAAPETPVVAEAHAKDSEASPVEASVPLPPKPSYTDFLVSSAPELVRTAPMVAPKPTADLPENELAPETELEEETPEAETQKKKRRSRGGAKRTARKNAARLAAEQAALGLVAPEMGEDVIEAAVVDNANPANQAEETVDTLAATESDVSPESALVEDPASPSAEDTAENQPAAAIVPDLTVVDAEPASPEAEVKPKAAPKKRSTAPVAKKSKVIAKSAPVKRGSRRPAAATEPAPAAPAPTTVATPAAEVPASVAAPADAQLPTNQKAPAARPPRKKAAPAVSKSKQVKKDAAATIAPPANAPTPDTTSEPVALAIPSEDTNTGARRGRPAGVKKKRANGSTPS